MSTAVGRAIALMLAGAMVDNCHGLRLRLCGPSADAVGTTPQYASSHPLLQEVGTSARQGSIGG